MLGGLGAEGTGGMADNVIEVDFTAKDTVGELLAEGGAEERLRKFDVKAEAFLRSIDEWTSWHQMQLRLAQHRCKLLREQLQRERVESFAFTDSDVLEALRSVYSGVSVSASEVAQTLYGRKPPHHARVRTGLALSRLAAQGAVGAVPPGRHVTNRWFPKETAHARLDAAT